LNLPLGAANTAVLICSSLTVALAIRATQMGKRMLTVVLLLLTMVFGMTFLVIKGFEWKEKYEKHHIPGASFRLSAEDMQGVNVDPANMQDFEQRTQTFYSLYFAMTGLHALHMIIGVGLFLYLTYAAWKGTYGPGYFTPLENGGLYWHFVDIVWIYLFPLLYLIDRNLAK
jgi:cytochrome c oxidase subunit 3